MYHTGLGHVEELVCHLGLLVSLLLLSLSIQTNVSYRIGTCGGIGLPPGTVVVTEEAVDGRLRPFLDTVAFNHCHHHP